MAKLSSPIWDDKELEMPAMFAPAVGQMMYCPEIELEEELLEVRVDDIVDEFDDADVEENVEVREDCDWLALD